MFKSSVHFGLICAHCSLEFLFLAAECDPVRSSAVVVHPSQGCTFRDAFLLVMVVKSGVLTYRRLPFSFETVCLVVFEPSQRQGGTRSS